MAMLTTLTFQHDLKAMLAEATTVSTKYEIDHAIKWLTHQKMAYEAELAKITRRDPDAFKDTVEGRAFFLILGFTCPQAPWVLGLMSQLDTTVVNYGMDPNNSFFKAFWDGTVLKFEIVCDEKGLKAYNEKMLKKRADAGMPETDPATSATILQLKSKLGIK